MHTTAIILAKDSYPMENAYAYKHTKELQNKMVVLYKELQNKMVVLYNLTTNKMAAS